MVAVVVEWRCNRCSRSEAEGAKPRYRRSPIRPEAWCDECNRAYNRLVTHNRRARNAGLPSVASVDEIRPAEAKRLRVLSKRWYKYAKADEEKAAEIESRDPWMAARLRDRAENWRGLARQGYRGAIE